jgi:hypothetical protein
MKIWDTSENLQGQKTFWDFKKFTEDQVEGVVSVLSTLGL